MKISQAIYNNKYAFQNRQLNSQVDSTQSAVQSTEGFSPKTVSVPITASTIAFKGLHNINPRKINIAAEKSKLIRILDDMLQAEVPEKVLNESIVSTLIRSLGNIRRNAQKRMAIVDKLEKLNNDKTITPQQKLSRANAIKKEWKILEKSKVGAKPSAPVSKKDEKIDYSLMNKFKSAIVEDDFNLRKVFEEHYSKLNEIKTVKELKELFPHIKIPQKPEKVIAKKIESILTRDFFEKFDDLFKGGEDKKLFEFADDKIREVLKEAIRPFGIDSEIIYNRVAKSVHKTIAAKYMKIQKVTGFSSVPQVRKNTNPQINAEDLMLLATDFDDFVLSVLKKHYLETQKLNEIDYMVGNVKIQLALFQQQNDYKFEKLSEKTKSIINSSKTLHDAQRNYEGLTPAELKARLSFLASKDAGNDEQLFEQIIAFDNCNFGEDDTKNIVKFLKELDHVNDGEKTCSQAIETIKKEGIRPKDTERFNEIEKKKMLEKFKLEQKIAFELKTIKNKFDDAMNLLYMNNLNDVAMTCSKYRPDSLNKKTVENADFIIDMIAKNIKANENGMINKAGLESSIFRWDTFNHYKTNEPTNPVFKKAIQFAQESSVEISIDKAGKYLINSELVENFPESLEFASNPEVLSKIMEKAGSDKDSAIRYLCKFDDYADLPVSEKSFISKFIDIFNTKDMVDKNIFKHIVENDYVNVETKALVNINEGLSEAITAAITPEAKKAIMDKYKFPLCIGYMRDFEEALSSFATKRGSSGIKRIDGNNKAIEYKMELKLKDHDDRLFSSKNDYFFDIFSDKGLH